MRTSGQAPIRRCQRTSRSWPTARSSQGTRAIEHEHDQQQVRSDETGEPATGDSKRNGREARATIAIAGGRLAGFTGAYLMLIMVLLVAAWPGSNEQSARTGSCAGTAGSAPWALGLIVAHVVLITSGTHSRPRPGRCASCGSFVVLPGHPRCHRRFRPPRDGRPSPRSGSHGGGSSTRPGGSCTSTPT